MDYAKIWAIIDQAIRAFWAFVLEKFGKTEI